MRLHRTNLVAVGQSPGVISSHKGLLDETNTLNLTKQDDRWHVRVQSNGYRLISYRKMANARKYMEHVLEYAQGILSKMPLEYEDARVYAGAQLWDIHHAARAEVGWSHP